MTWADGAERALLDCYHKSLDEQITIIRAYGDERAGEMRERCAKEGCYSMTEGWVSVRDRLPEKSGTVATWDGAAVAWEYFNADTQRFHPNRGWQTRIGTRGKVRFWLPLPAPPEGDDEDLRLRDKKRRERAA